MSIKQAGSLPEVFKMHFHIAANRGMLKNSLALFFAISELSSHQKFLLKCRRNLNFFLKIGKKGINGLVSINILNFNILYVLCCITF